MTKRETERQQRVALLTRDFPRYLAAFTKVPPFRKAGQYELHVATTKRRQQLGSAEAAVQDEDFLRQLYRTLQAWGIDQRGSRLVPFDEFVKAAASISPFLAELDPEVIDSATLNVDGIMDRLWDLIDSLRIVQNQATLVPCTKALHHVLPDLVFPMDREYTRAFFAWHVPEFQYQQRKVFCNAYKHLAAVARQANPNQYVGSGWNTSRTKVLDNALVGFCQTECVPLPS